MKFENLKFKNWIPAQRTAGMTIVALLISCFMLMAPLPVPAATTNYSEVIPGIQVVPFYIPGAITADLTPVKVKLPFKAHVIGVSAYSRDIDTTSTDETYAIDIKEGATSILSSAISITADDTVYEGTVSDISIADEATVSILVDVGGTTPSIADLTVLLTIRRTN